MKLCHIQEAAFKLFYSNKIQPKLFLFTATTRHRSQSHLQAKDLQVKDAKDAAWEKLKTTT